MTWTEEHDSFVTYRIHESGRVAAYGRESGSVHGPNANRWIASSWSTDPRSHDDAVHIGHLCVEATPSELGSALRKWEAFLDSGEGRPVVSDDGECSCGALHRPSQCFYTVVIEK